ncbi:Gfo/Idh/MocA family protein [Shimwellia blattae]|uniref:Putative oxidoreductase n=1 Tax=Shimwellia blattae (strain ATCC 29907 / DSM 4481 / JCM 1650 / NBRC 105725 / CDC 9005-74) TaxID=630626 RepID=I2BAF9_SHIBC|nr:Gfo/Idh/MocA family oxidoreductase [Shimwellia blattae]AFJ47513.1 putative oxidoreductase [Shimwellia blattae DSM 4481 = NBRC 105725]GAB80296.1 virulence factor MviM homolog [Shimwellia blattae DSM 4481 = NBRC 105725]VDY65010.1 Virulence factor mviM homolog [Shimwellia blattae]VEC23324.1 Virulence factor mviM homolog [Shimwellia blattae]
MGLLRVGIVGLGNIARKAWLPVVATASQWEVAGAWSPNQQKAREVCAGYRIPCMGSLRELAAVCDAVFVHTSTASHYAVVSELLQAGVHVCVDKPLAESLSDAQRLVEMASLRKLTLMVGFNRRFAPLYRELKTHMDGAASLRIDKHRTDSVGPQDLRFTLLDDYLHVVDTALWLNGDRAHLQSGMLQTNDDGEMLFAEHHFACEHRQITTAMHRRAGSQRETVRLVTDGAVYEVNDMRDWQSEQGGIMTRRPVPGWQSTLAQRGFEGCARHFIECVSNQTAPETSGEQAILAQSLVDRLWREAMSE